MKNTLFTLVLFFAATAAKSQLFTINFENMVPDSGKVLNGSDGTTFFNFNVSNRKFRMPTFYDTSFGGFWSSGWALSRKLDSTTQKSNFAKHLYCAKPKFGDSGSKTFAVGQDHAYIILKDPSLLLIRGFAITNTTYAYNSMKLGDAFAKKFGGVSGNDSDYFFCRLKSYSNGKFMDSQDVFLADFRSKNNANDYILRNWKKVNFTKITDSVTFNLFSSDNSSWGINTPAFFAVDNFVFEQPTNVSKPELADVKIYPNPTPGELHIQSKISIKQVEVLDISQKICKNYAPNSSNFDLNMSDLKAGFYFIKMETENGILVKKIQLLSN